ncbi:hypothetical protein DID88_001901 [Monilinia fructigena]|uniref:Uncharacterized protein n=1 Tax=Monilinia fructigena TaxID=38457 RepID=A0A395IVU6_9HELO|nr:hypothetical protein DID88_001901 [Monilinia fructigena]
MKYTTAVLSGLMAATVVAQPHVRHQHAARHQKRDIVWVTESEIVTETVDYTTTIYVSPGYVAPTTTSVPSVPSVTPTTLATIPKSSAAASSSIPKNILPQLAVLPMQQFRTSNQALSSSTYVAPSSSTSVAAPVYYSSCRSKLPLPPT